MVSMTSIKGDNPYTMCPKIKDSDRFVALRDGVLKWFGDYIQFSIWITYPPYEVVDVGDMLLVWFICKYNKRTPLSFTSFGPTVGEELLELIHNDFRFIWDICRFLAAYWFGVTGVYTEFIAWNCSTGALFAKSVPIWIISLLVGSSKFLPIFRCFSNLAASKSLINSIKSFSLAYSQ